MDDVVEQDVEEEEVEEGLFFGVIFIRDCLFCFYYFSLFMKNVVYMIKVYSFFIFDIEYFLDIKGLIKYLGEKVGVGKICLWCNEKGKFFYFIEVVQVYMNDKSYCKFFIDGDVVLEFVDFYDFRSSYLDYKEGEDFSEVEELFLEKNLEYDDEIMELILFFGVRVGYCFLMRYYKQ